MFPVFHLAELTCRATKTFFAGWRKLLWKVERWSPLSNKFWLCCSFFIKLTTSRANKFARTLANKSISTLHFFNPQQMLFLHDKLITQFEKCETLTKTCNETMLRDKLRTFVSRILPPLFQALFSMNFGILHFKSNTLIISPLYFPENLTPIILCWWHTKRFECVRSLIGNKCCRKMSELLVSDKQSWVPSWTQLKSVVWHHEHRMFFLFNRHARISWQDRFFFSLINKFLLIFLSVGQKNAKMTKKPHAIMHLVIINSQL